LAVNISLQILFALATAAVKMQISKRSQLTADATYRSSNSSNSFDASQGYGWATSQGDVS